jgi:glycosyltransferase involved in cell wall biosynthesis
MPIPCEPTVSIVMAVHRAETTLARAVTSLLEQTLSDFEVILVSDDGTDQIALLGGLGISDRRLVQVSTGRIGAGCTRARNLGLGAARGRFVTRLDADDAFAPDRLARLVALAERFGAATDAVEVIDDATGATLWHPFAAGPVPAALSAADLGRMHAPFVPLVARALAPPWFEDVDISEDVLFLFALEERAGRIAVEPAALYRYFVRSGSMCHGDDGAERADRSYAAIDARLAAGGFAGIGPATAARARIVFAEKRAFNRAFAEAHAAGRAANFQEFCAQARPRRAG